MRRKPVIIILFGSSLIPLIFTNNTFALEENWVEVDRFTGGSWIGGTRLFIIDHVEWRIRWSWKKTFGLSLETPIFFRFNVLDFKNRHVELIDTDHKTNGTVYLFQNRQCFYYLYIMGINLENYTIIIEENIDSIPEFRSWIILPISILITMIGIIIRKKIKKKGKI